MRGCVLGWDAASADEKRVTETRVSSATLPHFSSAEPDLRPALLNRAPTCVAKAIETLSVDIFAPSRHHDGVGRSPRRRPSPRANHGRAKARRSPRVHRPRRRAATALAGGDEVGTGGGGRGLGGRDLDGGAGATAKAVTATPLECARPVVRDGAIGPPRSGAYAPCGHSARRRRSHGRGETRDLSAQSHRGRLPLDEGS